MYPDVPTARPMNAWDIPVLLLHTPTGLVDAQNPNSDVRHFLIEGHLRMRYLSALVHRSDAAPSHGVSVLQYGSIKSPQN